MMMQMIDCGGLPVLTDDVRAPDEDNPKGYYEFEPVKKTKEDPSWIEQGVGKAVKMVHLLLLDLPLSHRYRVIFMRRNLEEVIQSQDVMLARSGKPTDDLPPERLKRIYKVQIDDALARMRRNFDHFRFIEVNYNQLMKDPQPQAERVSALLDGLDVERMISVVDTSLYRRRVTT